MNKNRIKELLKEDLEYSHVNNKSVEEDEYEIGELTEDENKNNELFEETLLKRVKENGVKYYKSLKRKSK